MLEARRAKNEQRIYISRAIYISKITMDKKIICKNCNNEFVWSLEEQELYAVRQLQPPEHCPICRGIIEARSKDRARSKYERRT
ncbi:MAG: hypothetical protein Fur0011_2240 [Candidatus Microgenomates bacterium]